MSKPVGPAIESPPALPTVGEQAELLGLVRLLLRRKYWLVGTVAVALVLAAAYCLLVPPLYEAQADILMNVSQPQLPDIPGLGSIVKLAAAGPGLETAARVLESWTLQAQALALLNAHPSFFRDCTLGKRTCRTIVDIPPEVARTYADHPTINQLPEIYKQMIDELSVKRVGASDIIRIRTVSTDHLAACDFVNALCATYLLWRQERSRFAADLALRQLREEIRQAERRLKQAEDRLEEFQRTHKLVDASAQAQDLVNRLGKLQEELASLQADLEAQRAQERYLEAEIRKLEPTQISATVVSNNPLVQEIRKKLLDLYSQRAELLQEYTENSRAVRAIDREIDEVKQKLAETVENIVSSQTKTPNPLRTALISQYAQGRAATIALEVRLPVTQRMLAALEQEIENLPPDARQLAALKREVEIQQQRYLALRQQEQAQEAARDQMVADDTVLAAAQVLPWEEVAPVRPRPLLTLLLAIVLGTLLGMIAAVFAEQLDETYSTVESAEAEVGLPTLGTVPAVNSSMPLLTDPDAPPAVRRAFVGIATGLQLAKPAPANQVIAVTGTRRGEGRTSIAANLGLTLAMMGRDVLLLDCDLDHPDLCARFDVAPSGSLADVAAGRSSVDAVRGRPLQDLPLSVMTLGFDATSFANWVGAPQLLEALDRLRKDHEVIILDLAPCREANEVPWISSLADVTVLLLVLRSSSRADMIRAENLLVRSGARLGGMIVNRYGTANGGRNQT